MELFRLLKPQPARKPSSCASLSELEELRKGVLAALRLRAELEACGFCEEDFKALKALLHWERDEVKNKY